MLCYESMATQPPYATIPDTSDRTYWQLKTDDAGNLLQTFVPIDPQLHRQLKTQAWKVIQLKLANKIKPLPPLDLT